MGRVLAGFNCCNQAIIRFEELEWRVIECNGEFSSLIAPGLGLDVFPIEVMTRLESITLAMHFHPYGWAIPLPLPEK